MAYGWIRSLGVVALVAGPAAAQPAGNFALDEFAPAVDSRGYITVNASEVLGDRELSFGLGSLEWGHHLLDLAGGGNSYAIDDMVSATLVGAIGLRLGPLAFELGVSSPFSIVSGDRGPAQIDTTNPNNSKQFKIDGQGIGDIGVHFKTRLLDSRSHFLGLGVVASLFLPTTSSADRFLGDPDVTPQVIGIVDKELGRFRLALNAGYRYRTPATFDNSDPGSDMAPVTNRSVSVGSELPVKLGVAWALAPEKVELVGEVFGAIPLGTNVDYQPLEALAGVKLYLAHNSYLSLGAGRGLMPASGGNPDARAFIGIVFEPKAFHHEPRRELEPPPVEEPPPPRDRDGDRIAEVVPNCIEEPQSAGCFDLHTVIDDGAQLVLLEPINFEFDKAVIRKDSFGILDAVVAAMQKMTDIRLLDIEGHTDERGDDAYNLDLSDRRAAAVVTYLVDHGIDRTRLESHGYGETRPVDKAHDERAWAKNRRVEFVIIDRTDRTAR